MKKIQEQFLKIPYSILESKDLNDGEKITLMLIYSYHNNQKQFYMSNTSIGELIGCSRTGISKRITKLESMGYIKCEYTYKKNSKEIDKRIIIPNKVVPQVSQVVKLNHRVVPQVSVGSEIKPQGSSSIQQGVVPQIGSIRLPSLLDELQDDLLNKQLDKYIIEKNIK
jgi:hypothetical protein